MTASFPVDLDLVKRHNKFVLDAQKIGDNEYQFLIENPHTKVYFKVKVEKTDSGEYRGIPSHRIRDYVSFHYRPTPTMAVDEALSGLSAWYNRDDYTQLQPYEDYDGEDEAE